MDNDARKEDITLKSPAELVQAVPYLLGYHPVDRLVAIGLADGEVAVGTAIPVTQVKLDGLGSAVKSLQSANATEVLLVGYGPADDITPVMDRCRSDLSAKGMRVVDALRVTGDRMWSYMCNSTQCCPPEGTPVDMDASPVAASMVANGASAVASREDIDQLLAPVTGAEHAAMELATAQAGRRLKARFGHLLGEHSLDAAFVEAGKAQLDKVIAVIDALPGVDDIAELGYYLIAPAVMDEVIRRIDIDGARECLPLWMWMTRHLNPELRWLAANATTFAAWRSGNGVLANVALRISLDGQPDPTVNRAGYVIRTILAQGIPPHGIPPFPSITAMDPPTPFGDSTH